MAKKQIKTKKKIVTPTKSTIKVKERNDVSTNSDALIWGRSNYILMLIGIGLVLLGMILMMGGQMPSPDVFDESIIYSPIRITLAPIVILAGLALEIYAIFKHK